MDRTSYRVVGRIFTGRRFVESFVVDEGRVVAVGTRRSTQRECPTGADRIEARSTLVLPGLVDAHVHPVHMALDSEGANLWGSKSVGDIVRRTGAWAARHPHGLVVGRGWDQEVLREHRFPRGSDLKAVAGDRPVVLFRVCSHAAVLNAAALDLIGVGQNARDPPGGRIGRDDSGRPNGLLFEEALRPVAPHVEKTVLTWKHALRDVLQGARRLGLTTVAPMSASPAEVTWGIREARRGVLPLRLRCYARLRDLRKLPASALHADGAWARVTGVKAVLDGSLGARTAFLRDPYADAENERGILLWNSTELRAALGDASDQGLGWALHAIGDGAVEQVVNLLKRNARRVRIRIEHASVTPPDLLGRLAVARPDIVVQPGFVLQDTWVGERLGAERARWTYAFRSLLDRSLRLAGSSDAPVDGLDPMQGIRAAVRRAPFRRAFEPPQRDERLTWAEALHLYTGAAGQVLGDARIGSLEAGSFGDWVVLRGTSLPNALGSPRSKVLETWIDGTCRYRAEDGHAGPTRAS